MSIFESQRDIPSLFSDLFFFQHNLMQFPYGTHFFLQLSQNHICFLTQTIIDDPSFQQVVVW